jgi:hypothetical protein
MDWTPPQWWWAAWCAVAVAFAIFRQSSPKYFTHLGWALTDYRLLLQSRGDFTAPWYSGWLQNIMAGLALALGVAGMSHRCFGAQLSMAAVARLWALWGTLMLIRWCAARLWEGISSGEIPGREWALGHRYLVEAMAWWVAPIGLCMTIWSPEASFIGLYTAAAVWAGSWILRHRRSFSRITRLSRHPVEGIFYLCALEFLPVAVLVRAWQW